MLTSSTMQNYTSVEGEIKVCLATPWNVSCKPVRWSYVWVLHLHSSLCRSWEHRSNLLSPHRGCRPNWVSFVCVCARV